MTQTRKSATAASPDLKMQTTSPQDVRNIYVAILGRQAESDSVVIERAGSPLSDAMAALVASDEFGLILNQIAAGGGLPTGGDATAADFATVAAWLSSLLNQPMITQVSPRWSVVLRQVAQIPGLLESAHPADKVQAVLEQLDRIASDEHRTADLLQGVLHFGPVEFARTSAGRGYASKTGGVDTTLSLLPNTQTPRVLPFFTEGLERLDHSEIETLQDLVEATESAAAAGRLGHWLFDERTYAESLKSLPRSLKRDRPAVSPYLQFLALRQTPGVRPHPLFSAVAYEKLNPGLDLGGSDPFSHYIRLGARAGLATSPLFDTAFYLSRHPQVRQDLATGRYSSALEHFLHVGMRAGCSFSPDFDRDYYLSVHADVAAAIEAGHLPSAEWHFVMSGAWEGRRPNRFFDPAYYEQRYPHVRKEMAELGLQSLLEHFLLLGRARGWRVNQPPITARVDIDQAKALFEKRGRRAYSEALSGVFAFHETPQSPGLSVIVPISGQADFTAGFLKCARWASDHLEHKRGVTTEIIVVDNGSKDHTASLLAALPGVRVVTFDQPIGFPAAVNAGTAASRGEVVLVANNDIQFEADAFLRLYDALKANPQFGVVGAKVILPNETLQEVGSILDKDAGAMGFGRGMDAVDCNGSRIIEVDYASGCFVAFTRADFDALSGFDEAYSPGYYEEVDFSLRMKRDLGKPTVVDSGLAVTHYEHASFAKGRPQTVNEPLILRNRARLKSAHAPVFNALRSQDPHAPKRLAQRALAGRARILVVEDMVPSGLLGSGFGREEEILDLFRTLGIAFDVLALNASPKIDEYKDPMARLFRAWMPGESLDDVLTTHPARYSHLWLCRTHNLGRSTAAIREAKEKHGLQIVCDTEALSSLRLIEQMRTNGQAPSDADVLALAAGELADPLEVDMWIAVNRRERELMNKLGLTPVKEIGHAVTLKSAVNVDAPFGQRDRMLFVGAVHELSSPNYDGLEWFLTKVYPRLDPATRPPLTVAGFWATGLEEIFRSRFSDVPIEFLGSVSNLELARLYSESRLTIAPTRFAAGIPCKVIESVLAGVPIVMTDLLAEQLEADHGPDLAAAERTDNGTSFARWVETLYLDPEAWADQRDLQRNAIGNRWSPEKLAEQVEAVVEAIGI